MAAGAQSSPQHASWATLRNLLKSALESASANSVPVLEHLDTYTKCTVHPIAAATALIAVTMAVDSLQLLL